jgi:hypothetical protein
MSYGEENHRLRGRYTALNSQYASDPEPRPTSYDGLAQDGADDAACVLRAKERAPLPPNVTAALLRLLAQDPPSSSRPLVFAKAEVTR